MRKLAFTVVALAGLMQATGCIFITDDEDGGYIHGDWTLEVEGGGPITCAEVNADYVSFLSTLEGTTDGIDEMFDCSAGQGMTGLLSEGSYTVSVTLWQDPNGDTTDVGGVLTNAADDVKLSGEPGALYTGEVVTLGETTHLTKTIFEFPPLSHDITFKVDYGMSGGSNCSSGADGNTGVAQQETQLLSGNQCLAVALTGGDQSGTTCEAPILCLENTVVQTLSDVPAGTYTLRVKGRRGATGVNTVVCYSGDIVFEASQDGDIGTVAAVWAPEDEAECNKTKPGSSR